MRKESLNKLACNLIYPPEWLVPGHNELDSILRAGHGEDGEEGTEDLLLHHGLVLADLGDDSGGDIELSLVGVTPYRHLPLGGVEHVIQSVPVPLIDDPTEILTALRILPVPFEKNILNLFQKLGLDLGGTDEVVRGNAGLAKIDTLGPQQPPGHHVDVGGGVHPDRALAPKLQRDWGEVPVGRLPHLLPDHSTPREEDVVKLFLGQGVNILRLQSV